MIENIYVDDSHIKNVLAQIKAINNQLDHLTLRQLDELHTAVVESYDNLSRAKNAAEQYGYSDLMPIKIVAIWDLAWKEIWEKEITGSSRSAAWSAVQAILTKGHITPEQYEILVYPWTSVMGSVLF